MTDNGRAEMQVLPLSALHQRENAPFMGLNGWMIPAHYGDPEGEYKAATESAGLFDASLFTVVRASGADHEEYLNRRTSQRVIEMAGGDGLRANFLSGEGRMDADLEVFRLPSGDSLLFAPPAVTGEYLQTLADKYVFTEDAAFADETAQWAAFALIGPKSGQVLEAMGIAPPAGKARLAPAEVAGGEGWVIRSEFLFNSHVLLVPVEAAENGWKRLLEAVREEGGLPVGFLPFDTLRVESGVAWWGIDLNDRSIPLEADLMSAIHTNKGCYPGQETIAKILNLGHPARKLAGVVWESEDPPAAGVTLLSEGKEAGRLTSSTFSPRLGKAIGLAMVKWPHRNEGTALQTEEGLPGVVRALPFQ